MIMKCRDMERVMAAISQKLLHGGHAQQRLVLRQAVESIAHLYGDQNRQGHGHGRRSLEDLTIDAGKVLVLIVALHEV